MVDGIVELPSYEYINIWSTGFAYMFYIGTKPVVFLLHQNKIIALYVGENYTESAILIRRGSTNTPLLDLPLEDRDFFFREGCFELNRSELYNLRVNDSRFNLIRQLQVSKDQVSFLNGAIIMERDFACWQGNLVEGVMVYKRFSGIGKTCIEIDFWGEKDPALARFMRLMTIVYVKDGKNKEKGKNVSFVARNKRFIRFLLFGLSYEEVDGLFLNAVKKVAEKKEDFSRLLKEKRDEEQRQYKFAESNYDGWQTHYINAYELIDSALRILMGDADGEQSPTSVSSSVVSPATQL